MMMILSIYHMGRFRSYRAINLIFGQKISDRIMTYVLIDVYYISLSWVPETRLAAEKYGNCDEKCS